MNEIPTDWEAVTVADLLARRPKNGTSPVASDHFTGTYILGLGCLTKQGFAPTQIKNAPPWRAAWSASEVHEGDLLITRANTRELVGMVGRYRDVGARCIYPDLMMKLSTNSRVLPGFLECLLRSNSTRRQIQSSASGTSESMVKISSSIVLSLRVNIPPLGVQRKIVEILNTADESIRSTERLIAKLENVRRATVSAMFAKQAEQGCEVRRLDEVAEVDRGKFSARPRNDPRFYEGAYPFIQTGDISAANGSVIFEASQSLNELGRAISREFPRRTIAVTIAANIADTAILGKPMCFPDSVVGAVVSPVHVTRFVELAIRLAKPRLEARAPQSAQKNINLQDLRPLKIPVPPRQDQERIAEVYDALDQQILATSSEAAKLRRVRQGLMEDLLTGRVRVKVD